MSSLSSMTSRRSIILAGAAGCGKTTVGKIIAQRLAAKIQVALEHGADDFAAPGSALIDNALPDLGLAPRIFAGIRMTAVDHQHRP